MMENAKEKLSFLLSKKEKYIQNVEQQKENRDSGMDKHFVSDKNDFILDKNFNKCCFCTKIFLNSKFLIKHILRRHSEDLVVMYKKLSDLNASDLKNNLSQNDLITIITNEFSKLKNDLESIKSSISNNKSNSNFCHKSFIKESNDSQVYESFTDMIEKVDILTSEMQALRVTNAKIETDISDLQVQWKESDVKKFCNSTEVKETVIYQTLKDELLSEIQNLILKSNEEQKLNLDKLSLHFKADIERLEHLIKMSLENIDISNLVQETLKSLEKEIEFFFSCHKAKKHKARAGELNLPKEISQNVKEMKPCFSHDMSNYGSSERLLLLEKKLNSLNISGNTDSQSIFDSKSNTSKSCELSKLEKINANLKVENESSDVSEIPLLLEMKLNALNIPDGTKRLSNTDFTAKMKLVESEREFLSKKYPSFSDIHRYLSFTLDNSVFGKLNVDKKPKKIRFSLTPKQTYKNKIRNGDAKFTKEIADPLEGSSTNSRCVVNSPGSVTPINIPGMELKNSNSFNQFNSAASLKLISSSNGKRKLPNVPQSVPKELSSYDSLESDF